MDHSKSGVFANWTTFTHETSLVWYSDGYCTGLAHYSVPLSIITQFYHFRLATTVAAVLPTALAAFSTCRMNSGKVDIDKDKEQVPLNYYEIS